MKPAAAIRLLCKRYGVDETARRLMVNPATVWRWTREKFEPRDRSLQRRIERLVTTTLQREDTEQ